MPIHSPLLEQSLLLAVPPLSDMLKFGGSFSVHQVTAEWCPRDPTGVGRVARTPHSSSNLLRVGSRGPRCRAQELSKLHRGPQTQGRHHGSIPVRAKQSACGEAPAGSTEHLRWKHSRPGCNRPFHSKEERACRKPNCWWVPRACGRGPESPSQACRNSNAHMATVNILSAHLATLRHRQLRVGPLLASCVQNCSSMRITGLCVSPIVSEAAPSFITAWAKTSTTAGH